jgi:hypothetical protein
MNIIKSFLLISALFISFTISSQAQVADSIVVTDSLAQPLYKSLAYKVYRAAGVVIPVGMITYGVISFESDWAQNLDLDTRYELHEDNYLYPNQIDNYLQYFPAAATFGLKAFGVESKSNWADMVIMYALSNAIETGVVYTTKTFTERQRPDGSSFNSFPSGHTATAFVAAEFLNQEYKDKSIWISVGGYSVASLIGFSRIFNNRHWVSDVVAGAGIGMLSTKIVYWTYPYVKKAVIGKNKETQTLVFPTYNNGNVGLMVCCTF